jgi:hypothetical protein
MNEPHLFQGIEPDTFLTTETFAAKLSLNPQSIRKRYSQTGAYYGVRPVKMRNGRLLWPSQSVAKLLLGGAP